MRKAFFKGLSDGLPIGLGYFSVAFGFGIMAVNAGISAFFAWLISATNLTSAGQAAGVEVIAACGTLIEMALTQLVINLRYSLMGFSLTQKLDSSFTTPKRLILAFGITDEIYAMAISQKGKISASYMTGLMVIPFIGWTGGTLVGAFASQLLPEIISNVMGIMLYGMFIAIFIPASKKSRPILTAVLIAVAFSIIFRYFLTFISSGFAIILSAVISAVICAALFPVKEEDTV
jgi:predicted branched-subunit amino acid permease